MKIDKIESFCWKIIPSLILLLLVDMNIEGNIKKFDELVYGSRIRKIYLKDINKEEIIIPQENKVNVIFFF